MNASSPLVSVLMPVYNAAPYIAEAIQSILRQTFTDFELLIFNDGSTDESSSIIRSIKDERIVFFDYKENSGYVTHLNKGLHIAKGTYIARMDADDIALPERFEKQVNLLENEPAVGLCGTRYQMFGSRNEVIHLPISDKKLREFMLEYSPMGHPTVMFRRALINKYGFAYDEAYMPAEDYKMWYDFSKVSELRNLPEILLFYRVHPHQISVHQNSKQRIYSDAVRVMQLLDKGFELNLEEQKLYCRIIDNQNYLLGAEEFSAASNLMQKIISANELLLAYNPKVFIEMFTASWHRSLSNIRSFTPSHIIPILLRKKPIAQHMSWINIVKFILKAVVYWKVKALD